MSPSRSRHLVDPVLGAMLDAMPRVPLNSTTLAAVRAASELPLPFDFGGDAAAVVVEDCWVPGHDSVQPVHARYYRPEGVSANLPCVFHIHGGGYVAGAAAAMEPAHRALVAELGCGLFSVDYRLSPEYPYPVPLMDCYTAFDWLFREAAALRVDTMRIGVMGESAGGGLAAAVALLARDRNQRRLAFQLLVYPMLDDRTCVMAEPHPYTGDYVWTASNNHFGWRSLLGHEPGGDLVTAYAAPARALDLGGLPPTFIATGALDLFLEEDMEYARRLLRAGVPTELQVYPGAVHGFDLFPVTDLARRARRDVVAALSRFMNLPAVVN